MAAAGLVATRPTATNLAWGVERARVAADPIAEAVRIADEDVQFNRRLGAHGAALIDDGARVLTHCNAGALGLCGLRHRIGVIRAAHEAGKRLTVWVDETRPVLQGGRLTAWELQRLDIPCAVIPDALAGALMGAGEVDAVVVGADRIAANGDVANKVGTYSLAVLAHHHDLPFYVAAPTSTFDEDTPTGADIPIERRAADEVVEFGGLRVAPMGVGAENRAFDVTPAALVAAYVTENGVTRRS